MSPSRSTVLVRHNLALLLTDPAPIVTLLLLPIVMMAFLKPSSAAVLGAAGFAGTTGAEQVVPGMAILFGFFGVGFLGSAFYREHGWGTWTRLLVSPAGRLEVLVGKAAPSFIVILAQLAVLFTVGFVALGLPRPASFPALAALTVGTVTAITAIAMALVALCRTLSQMMVAGNLGGMVFAGLGGALAPIDALPGWAQVVAPASPAYWSLRGYRSVFLEGAQLTEVTLPLAMLGAFALGAVLLAAWRFRFADVKVADT